MENLTSTEKAYLKSNIKILVSSFGMTEEEATKEMEAKILKNRKLVKTLKFKH